MEYAPERNSGATQPMGTLHFENARLFCTPYVSENQKVARLNAGPGTQMLNEWVLFKCSRDAGQAPSQT